MLIIKSTEGNLRWYTGGAVQQQVYANSGVFILTNGLPTNGQYADVTRQTEDTGEDRPIGRPIQAPDASTVKPDQGAGVIYETNTRPPLARTIRLQPVAAAHGRPAEDLPEELIAGHPALHQQHRQRGGQGAGDG